MLAPRRLGAAAGLVLMSIGAVGPWASAQSWMAGTVQVSGADHGAALVLGCAALAAVLLFARLAGAAAVCGAVAAAWMALALYELPGSLLLAVTAGRRRAVRRRVA